jgi:autotransporter passenger strand-loop-strand repeat protein/uncharacterized repeat protein (TIGR03803 family)
MTMFTAPPDKTGLILNAFDTLNVFSGGTATGTIINENAVENVNPGGKALFTIMNGGTLNVGGTSIGATVIGNFENVFGGGTVTDTTINAGGNEFLNAGTTAIDSIINAGGVQSGSGTAIGTLINEGGRQDVSGLAKDTIINGGLESVSNGGVADGVTFVGPHSTLALATPSGLTGFIRNWHVGDIIDFQNTMVTGVNETGNTLKVTYGDHQTASYSLAGQQANTEFKLQSDGNGGTELMLFAISLGAQPFSPESAGTIVYTAEFGAAPDATELNVLIQFTQAQFAYGQQIGVDAGVYAFTALGVALASSGQQFQNTFGPSNSAYPTSAAGDALFVTDAYASVFGHPGSAAQVQHFVDQLSYYEGVYTAAGTFGTASNIDLLARGAVYGQMLGIEHENAPLGTIETPPPITLINFDHTHGANPVAGLIADAAGNLFGTTQFGGANNDGTVFEITGITVVGVSLSSASLFDHV